MYEELLKEERKAQEALLAQYKKEYDDLKNGRGLATQMIRPEINSAMAGLKSHIASLEKYLNVDLRIEEIEVELDRLSNNYDRASEGLDAGDGTTIEECNAILNRMRSLRAELDRLIAK